MYGLIDCNNFFASCEQIFDPSLKNKPIVVLSNNDGCIIARSKESKKLGIPMGAPFFKWKNFIEENKVKVFSSNYELYGDISARIISIIANMTKHYEIYSIDEAFIYLGDLKPEEIPSFLYHIKNTIYEWVGITVSIGIGPTKTLAKAANYVSKKKPLLCIYDNIFDLRDADMQNLILSNMKLTDIWGISGRWSDKIESIGIKSAKSLRDFDQKILRKKFGVIMEKIILELRGISCIKLENLNQKKKNIICSRSFGKKVTDLAELEEAISWHVARACVKLRAQNSVASGICVYLKGDKFSSNIYKYSDYQMFDVNASNTSYIIKVAKNLLHGIYNAQTSYKKSGIMLIECKDASHIQYSFFDQTLQNNPLMELIDEVNNHFGRDTLFFASCGTNSIKQNWRMKRNLKSPNYIGNWNELLLVK